MDIQQETLLGRTISLLGIFNIQVTDLSGTSHTYSENSDSTRRTLLLRKRKDVTVIRKEHIRLPGSINDLDSFQHSQTLSHLNLITS